MLIAVIAVILPPENEFLNSNYFHVIDHGRHDGL